MRSTVLVLVALALLTPAASALPTPGVNCDLSEPTTGRVFPEATQTNDYVSYDEARCGLAKLIAAYPTWLKEDLVGKSVGWTSLTGQKDQFDVFVIRVSNYESSIKDEDKIRLVFQLSIHGNEKGGREGGLRVIEDFARDLALAQEKPELRKMLDWAEVLFVFPNPDGWTHEEAQYRHNDACYFSVTCGIATQPGQPGLESQGFVRVNGNGVDLNREWPTVGWQFDGYTAMVEPEPVALVNYLKALTNVKYASDIHGMLNPADGKGANGCATPGGNVDPTGFDPTCFPGAAQGAQGHFVLTMLPAGRQDPREMVVNTALAEHVRATLNNDPYFAGWSSAPQSAEGAWGGDFNSWGTVWDTIGYTDSGFTSDWYAQDHGLNAAGVDFELSYNHITVDNYYPGAGQVFNDYHVRITRDIVAAFMEHAAMNFDVKVDAGGKNTAWLRNGALVTNEGRLAVPDWAKDNANDDAYDAAHRVFRASPNDYFVDLKARLTNGAMDEVTPGDLASKLGNYQNLIVAGAAYDSIKGDAGAKSAIKAWVEKGGNLLLTDDALQLLPELGVAAAGSVEKYVTYAGHTNFVAKDHALAKGILGLARQTYEPVPLGYTINEFAAPVWFVKADAFTGDVVGVGDPGSQLGTPDNTKVNFGQAAVGSGTVSFLGALLPTPQLDDAVYGVDGYATTYTGNQLFRNALGFSEVVSTAAAMPGEPYVDAGGSAAETKTPFVLAPVLIALLLGVAIVLRRRS